MPWNREIKCVVFYVKLNTSLRIYHIYRRPTPEYEYEHTIGPYQSINRAEPTKTRWARCIMTIPCKPYDTKRGTPQKIILHLDLAAGGYRTTLRCTPYSPILGAGTPRWRIRGIHIHLHQGVCHQDTCISARPVQSQHHHTFRILQPPSQVYADARVHTPQDAYIRISKIKHRCKAVLGVRVSVSRSALMMYLCSAVQSTCTE